MVDPTVVAETISTPFFTEIKVIFGIVAAVLAAAYPIMQLIRKFNSDKAANSKDSAETVLYEHLQKTVTDLREELDKEKTKNQALLSLIQGLEHRIAKLEECETNMEKLKKRLNDKDVSIEAKDKKIHELFDIVLAKDREIRELKERVAVLEERLNQDEKSWCNVCKYKPEEGETK